MSKEKLYVVKNDEGNYLLDFSLSIDYPEWTNDLDSTEIFVERHNAVTASNSSGGHVVALIEEPKKVVLTKEQAKIVEGAKKNNYPASFISDQSYAEELLMEAFVNGYTVAKEKKYNVKVPHAVNSYYKKIDPIRCIAGDKFTVDLDEDLAQFTSAEIEHYGLQDCEKEEVTDDEQ